MRVRVLVSLMLAACARLPPPPAEVLRVGYLANEGVVLEAGDVQVVIDGLHRPNDFGYPTLDDAAAEALETGARPWAGVDLVLVTHHHRDHFHPEAVARNLAATGAVLVAPPEAVAELERDVAGFAAAADRVRAPTWRVGASETVAAAGVRVTVFGLSHGDDPARIQNLGYLVELGGRRVLHVGDAVPTAANFAPFELPARGIDVACLPWWFFASDGAARVVREHIAPAHVVVVHVGTAEVAEARGQVEARAPGATLFVRTLIDELRL